MTGAQSKDPENPSTAMPHQGSSTEIQPRRIAIPNRSTRQRPPASTSSRARVRICSAAAYGRYGTVNRQSRFLSLTHPVRPRKWHIVGLRVIPNRQAVPPGTAGSSPVTFPSSGKAGTRNKCRVTEQKRTSLRRRACPEGLSNAKGVEWARAQRSGAP
jgi:hypothetical protein